MFGLGRKKSKFTERYNRIGSGQRIGIQPTDEDQSDPTTLQHEEGDAAGVVTDADADHDRGSTAELPDPVQPYQGTEMLAAEIVTDQASHGAKAPVAVVETLPDVQSQSDAQLAAGQRITDPGMTSRDPDAAQDPQLSRVHANGHDYRDGEEELPSWLDSFDPAQPPIKPPELPQIHVAEPIVTGETATDAAQGSLADSAASVRPPALKPRGRTRPEPEPEKAEPAPSWLDTAEVVESRPPRMEFGGEPELPEAENDGSAEIDRKCASPTEATLPENSQLEPVRSGADAQVDETGPEQQADSVEQAISNPTGEDGIAGQAPPEAAIAVGHRLPGVLPAAIDAVSAPAPEGSRAGPAKKTAEEVMTQVPVKAVAPPVPLPPPF